MKYLIDTNVISAARRPDRAPKIAAWLRGRAEADLYLSAITIGEIERGIQLQATKDPGFARDLQDWLDRTVLLYSDRILAFGPEDARIWGQLSAKIGHHSADLMIAATALHHGATIVTGNVADFEPTGVMVENPF